MLSLGSVNFIREFLCALAGTLDKKITVTESDSVSLIPLITSFSLINCTHLQFPF